MEAVIYITSLTFWSTLLAFLLAALSMWVFLNDLFFHTLQYICMKTFYFHGFNQVIYYQLSNILDTILSSNVLSVVTLWTAPQAKYQTLYPVLNTWLSSILFLFRVLCFEPSSFTWLPKLEPSETPLTFFYINLFYFIYVFLAALGLCCCAWAFSSCSKWGLLFIAVRGLLIAVASLVAEHGL